MAGCKFLLQTTNVKLVQLPTKSGKIDGYDGERKSVEQDECGRHKLWLRILNDTVQFVI